MSKFNTAVKAATPNSTNLAGGLAYARTDTRAEIISVVLNSMLNGNSYYQSEKNIIDSIINLMAANDAEFLAKLMVYTRNTANLRSVSHILAVKLAEDVKGSSFMKSALTKTIVRPDDMTEMVSLWNARNEGKNIPNSMRRAMKIALESKFSEYHLAKYKQDRAAVKLKDIVKMVRPNPNIGKYSSENVFKDLIEGKLAMAETAQTVNAGSTGTNRAESYGKMLAEGTLGYMAGLKNIKNILDSAESLSTIEKQTLVDNMCKLFENGKMCHKAKVLPFRFTQALSAMNNISFDSILKKQIRKSMEVGFKYSAENLELVGPGERVALLLDESGSMGWAGPAPQPFDIGKTMMASMIAGLDADRTVGYLWADRCKEVKIPESPFDFIENTNTQGGGTDVFAPLNKLIESKTVVDLVVIFTDMQMYSVNSGRNTLTDKFKEYKKISPKAKLIFWNLSECGGATPMAIKHDVMEISGFSDSMLAVIPKLLKDKDALIKEIEAIQL
jgi:60 kDa SS-A/Ro ribonucleoprotein